MVTIKLLDNSSLANKVKPIIISRIEFIIFKRGAKIWRIIKLFLKLILKIF